MRNLQLRKWQTVQARNWLTNEEPYQARKKLINEALNRSERLTKEEYSSKEKAKKLETTVYKWDTI